MGMYRTVHLTCRCERCGRDRRDSIQFKTDSDDLQEYRLGEIVAPDASLRQGQRYPGIGLRYCGPCGEDWARAASQAWFEAVLDFARQNKLEVRDKATGTPMSLDDLDRRAAAKDRVFEVTSDESGNISSESFESPVEIVWKGEAESPLSQAAFTAQFALNDLLDKKVKTAGWEAGRDDSREDIEVYLDVDSRIQVHFPQ